MNRDTLTVFHELMKKGWIGRKENPLAWTAVQEDDVYSELVEMGKELDLTVTTEGPENVTGDEYSENMKKLAENWLGKLEGAQDSKKLNERYGILNKLLIKFRADDLFTEDGQQIRPTEKLQDLMPYVLRKERAVEVNRWLEGSSDAEDH